MSNGTNPLGLSCPSGGTFHACPGSASRFLGCCDVDPCGGDGGCPAASLRPASFDAARYGDVQAQGCAERAAGALWYTCLSGPFLGCCKTDPCRRGGVCPGADLVAAQLDADPSRASAFLAASSAPAATTTTTTTTTADSSTDDAANPTTSAGALPAEASAQSKTKWIIGGAVGGAAVVALLALAICLFCRRSKKRRESREMWSVSEGGGRITILKPPCSSYPGSRNGSPSSLPPSSTSSSTFSCAARGRRKDSYDALFDPARTVGASGAAGRATRGQYVNYSLTGGGRSPGLAVAAELEAPVRISELGSPAPGREVSGGGASCHEVEGSAPALGSSNVYCGSTAWRT